jgi:hypothetical protein
VDSKSAPSSAADGRRRKWIVAALFGGILLAYAASGFLLYEILSVIF